MSLRQESSVVPFTITITIGGAALIAIVGLVIKYLSDRNKKKNGGEK
jgi:hypothetical protein